MLKTGGQIVVDALRANGVDQIFGVPGESFLAILDALVDAPEIRLTISRHEGGAAMMAEAYGKLTGRPGICLVTRGPGATNASSGVHVAAQDSTPMILLIGQVARDTLEREAFQEVDFKAMFGDQVKWATQVNDAARLPEYLARAFATVPLHATAGFLTGIGNPSEVVYPNRDIIFQYQAFIDVGALGGGFALASTGRRTRSETVDFGAIGRAKVRRATVDHALDLLLAAVRG